MHPEIREQAEIIRETVRVLRAQMIGRFHSLLGASSQTTDLAHSLTVSQLNMLSVIRHYDGTTIKEIANALGVSAPSASAMVDRLVEMGAVTREQNPLDRREVIVSMSREATEVTERIEEQILAGIAELIEKIGPDYARQWCCVYKEILDVIAEETAGKSSH